MPRKNANPQRIYPTPPAYWVGSPRLDGGEDTPLHQSQGETAESQNKTRPVGATLCGLIAGSTIGSFVALPLPNDQTIPCDRWTEEGARLAYPELRGDWETALLEGTPRCATSFDRR
jgi:hypothetical protein